MTISIKEPEKKQEEKAKLSKNARKKVQRKLEKEKQEKLREAIYNGINGYSQEEASKSISSGAEEESSNP